ncbi:hypothetical protein [Actinopolymorpha singaporensis]|uniref:Uncharacterized protein n=1 Tax=Actinopolymorpha singaporensis TaxID=117157 RepID=A0A1H1US53_9ACTN|nr:hypothetical protein [Actinopolymorpha singaporensis]SDS74936.1 hypothetical protein SAMN04489717_3737 [Actinopolymorpha singaporensis]
MNEQAGVTRPRRWLYAAGLTMLAPFLAETVASSNTPAVVFPLVLPVLLLVYGVPALLVRELWVRQRIGWPGVLVLGLAYTLLNEGLVAATWFKLAPASGKVLVFTASQALHVGGVNLAVAAGLVVFHTVYSIVLPCALAHVWAGGARGVPWLGRTGIMVGSALVLLVMVGSLTPRATVRACTGPALASCTVGRRLSFLAIVLLVGLALALPKARAAGQAVSRPRPAMLVAAGAAFAVAFLIGFFVFPLAGVPILGAATAVALTALGTSAAVRWLRAPDWGSRSTVALAAGLLLPGMIISFKGFAVGQPLAAVAAAVLLWRLARRAAPCPVEPARRR